MRLVTFNILHGRSPADGAVDPDRLAAAVRALDPDVLALQEVDRDQPRSHRLDLTAVAAAAMGARSQRFTAAMSGVPGAGWTAAREDDRPGTAAYGIALLSRYPARSWRVLRLPRMSVRLPWYRSALRRVVRVDEEPRAAVVAELDTPLGPLVVAGTHLSFLPGWGRLQLRRIRAELARTPGPAVIMGDFNLARPGPASVTGFRSLARHRTFPGFAPVRQIDHILYRGGPVQVGVSEAVELPLSDHRALVVELTPTPVPDGARGVSPLDGLG